MYTANRRFNDRADAGKILASELKHYANRRDVVVLALPRGGVPVGYEVARELQAPLDVFLVRKIGVPGHEELAMGAVSTGGVRVLNEDVVASLGIPDHVIDAVADRELQELTRREQTYRGDRAPVDVQGQTAILVDDGLATGATMRAAAKALRLQNPARIVIAVPVAAPSVCDDFRREVDEIVCAATPEPFYAVGIWYEDFSQTTDEEVRHLLTLAEQNQHQPVSARRAA
jgi:putative phosphoribosyl transferase